MNKSKLVSAVAAEAKITKKTAEASIEAVVESVEEELAKGGNVGFGSFEVHGCKAHTGRNPQTGEALQIPAANYPGSLLAKHRRMLSTLKNKAAI